jgi:hypothetical protein
MTMPAYMKRYSKRLATCMVAYVGILIAGLTYARSGDPGQIVAIGLALATALPICGVFWALYRLLVECDDEYQRMLFVKQTLAGTGAMLVIVTVWNFLEVYDVLAIGPQWVAVIWFAMFGLAGPVVRWRA